MDSFVLARLAAALALMLTLTSDRTSAASAWSLTKLDEVDLLLARLQKELHDDQLSVQSSDDEAEMELKRLYSPSQSTSTTPNQPPSAKTTPSNAYIKSTNPSATATIPASTFYSTTTSMQGSQQSKSTVEEVSSTPDPFEDEEEKMLRLVNEQKEAVDTMAALVDRMKELFVCKQHRERCGGAGSSSSYKGCCKGFVCASSGSKKGTCVVDKSLLSQMKDLS